MPCNSDYMNATGNEIALSQVACLLDEIDGKPFNRDHWRGYHPRVYGRHGLDADAMVAKLCGHLRDAEVSKYSLEMQIWWRDHLAADKERVEREIREATKKGEREAALAKLTQHEKRLLGLT